MVAYLSKLVFIAVLLGIGAVAVYSQPPDLPDASNRSGRQRKDDMPIGLREMIAKQKLEREKKEHEEMLERGDEALRLAKQLEMSFEQGKGITQQDKTRLESLEKVVTKIRKELGGDDDDAGPADPREARAEDEPKPSSVEEGFKYLQSMTVKLVDELKKTTRFSISAIAIQSSNTVLKLVRFLRFRK